MSFDHYFEHSSATCPELHSHFPTVAAQRYEQNEAFFVKMFSDPEMMQMVMDTVGGVLYERLKKKKTVVYQMPERTLSMVAEEPAPYGKK